MARALFLALALLLGLLALGLWTKEPPRAESIGGSLGSEADRASDARRAGADAAPLARALGSGVDGAGTGRAPLGTGAEAAIPGDRARVDLLVLCAGEPLPGLALTLTPARAGESGAWEALPEPAAGQQGPAALVTGADGRVSALVTPRVPWYVTATYGEVSVRERWVAPSPGLRREIRIEVTDPQFALFLHVALVDAVTELPLGFTSVDVERAAQADKGLRHRTTQATDAAGRLVVEDEVDGSLSLEPAGYGRIELAGPGRRGGRPAGPAIVRARAPTEALARATPPELLRVMPLSWVHGQLPGWAVGGVVTLGGTGRPVEAPVGPDGRFELAAARELASDFRRTPRSKPTWRLDWSHMGAPGQPSLHLAEDLDLGPGERRGLAREWGPALAVVLRRSGQPVDAGTRFEVLREETAATDGGGPGVRYREVGRASVIHAGRLELPAAPLGWYVLRNSTPVVVVQADFAAQRGVDVRFEHTGAESVLELAP